MIIYSGNSSARMTAGFKRCDIILCGVFTNGILQTGDTFCMVMTLGANIRKSRSFYILREASEVLKGWPDGYLRGWENFQEICGHARAGSSEI